MRAGPVGLGLRLRLGLGRTASVWSREMGVQDLRFECRRDASIATHLNLGLKKFRVWVGRPR